MILLEINPRMALAGCRPLFAALKNKAFDGKAVMRSACAKLRKLTRQNVVIDTLARA